MNLVSAGNDYRLSSGSLLCYNDLVFAAQWLDRTHNLYAVTALFCKNRVISRKEFYESLFVLRALYPYLQRHSVVYELVAGHGLFSLLAALLIPGPRRFVLLDRHMPDSHEKMKELISTRFPFVKCRVRYELKSIETVKQLAGPGFIVGIHACGRITDTIIGLAIRSNLSAAVMPCCIDKRESETLLNLDSDQAFPDLKAASYEKRKVMLAGSGRFVSELTIPERLTPYNRILVGLLPRDTVRNSTLSNMNPLNLLPK